MELSHFICTNSTFILKSLLDILCLIPTWNLSTIPLLHSKMCVTHFFLCLEGNITFCLCFRPFWSHPPSLTKAHPFQGLPILNSTLARHSLWLTQFSMTAIWLISAGNAYTGDSQCYVLVNLMIFGCYMGFMADQI